MEALGDIFSNKTRESDAFCWACHRDEPELFCSECVRSFHISPACSRAKKMNAEEMGIWLCPDCVELKKDIERIQSSGIMRTHLNQLLKCVADLLLADEYLTARFLDVEYCETKGKVLNPLDLIKIGEKTTAGEYSCIEDFWSDIKWIVHNTKVHRSADNLAVVATRWLLKFTKDELYTVRLCHECYWNANQKRDDWFTKPCTVPHILVWAKTKGFPHWPGKVMSVDVDKQTVEVQFFGDHKRMTIAPKDCHIYTQVCPSANIASLRESFSQAVDEAKVYIRNLIMKFGSFHFAKPNVLLKERHMDRHLYEMIPNAWKGPSIPPEIPPKQVRSKNSRRETIPRIKSEQKNVKPIIGGAMTRRMSMALDAILASGDDDATEHTTFDHDGMVDIKPMLKATGTFSTSKFLNKQKAGQSSQSSLGNSAKKRKVSIESDPTKPLDTKPGITGHQATVATVVGAIDLTVQSSPTSAKASAQDNGAFKVPAPPSTWKTSKPDLCTFIPIDNIPTQPHQPIENGPTLPLKDNVPKSMSPLPPVQINDISLEVKKELLSPVEKKDFMDEFDVPLIEDPKLISSASVIGQCHSPEMLALCNAMIEQNTRKVSECIRLSLESSLVSFMDAANPARQIKILQDQLTKQRIENDAMVTILQGQNTDLSAQLEALKGKHEFLINKNNQWIQQNRDFIQQLTELKTENEKLIDDLKRELARNASLNSNLNAMSMQNTKLQSTVSRLQKISTEQADQLKSAEANNSYLLKANKVLMESTEKLKSQLDTVTLENKIQQNQMAQEKSECDLAKAKAFEDCAKLIEETKKKQWCATCGMPGGRFYCSSQCEEYYRKQQLN